MATRGTAKVIREAGYRCDVVNKVSEGRPNIVDELKNGNIQLVIAVAAESRSKLPMLLRSVSLLWPTM